MQTTDPAKSAYFREKGWWGNTTFTSLMDEAILGAPDRVALIDPLNRAVITGGTQCRLTYTDVSRLADFLAHRFREKGIGQGDKVIVQLPNIAELVISYLALDRLGAILSPVPMQYGRFELSHAAQETEADAYLTVADFNGKNYLENRLTAFPAKTKLFTFAAEPKENYITVPYFSDISPETLEGQAVFDRAISSADDIYTICWTSGTTGVPKGVPRHHNHWLSQVYAVRDAAPVDDGAVMLNPFPLTNMGAISGFLYYWPMAKACLVLHHPFDLQLFLTQIMQEKVSYTIAPPAVLSMFLQHTELHDKVDLSHVRYIASGSAPISPAVTKGFKELFDVEIVNFFGSNEGAGLVGGPVDVPDTEVRATMFPRFGRPEIKWSNRFAARSRTKLVDWQNGDREITSAKETGELLVTGPNVFDGYLGDIPNNPAVFDPEGYFRTGDLFQISDDGRFYIFVGRRKELIIRGGMNISPEELDTVVGDHPYITEAAVVGYPDDVMGEKVAAVIVTSQTDFTLETLKAYLAERGVAKYKWPEKLVITNALPRNAMNKVVRQQLSDFL
ncbi:class I adenylate-forming enzyme family protein [Kordiimonas pumila]|uniref:Class I adenylate-forming enzyme family protein n=1 Tax=Kordiimonas pumila TaxID=2161677 RepID=A0ABV7D7G6_9PROT|nr:class I adenylate-forming enzyme family protein [Kordiimonas pumila]